LDGIRTTYVLIAVITSFGANCGLGFVQVHIVGHTHTFSLLVLVLVAVVGIAASVVVADVASAICAAAAAAAVGDDIYKNMNLHRNSLPFDFFTSAIVLRFFFVFFDVCHFSFLSRATFEDHFNESSDAQCNKWWWA